MSVQLDRSYTCDYQKNMHVHVVCWITISYLFFGESAVPLMKKSSRPEMKILKQLSSCQLILFSTNVSSENHHFYRNILTHIPAISIDLSKMVANEEMRIPELTKNPTSSTVYVIFGTENTFTVSVKSTLDIFTQWSVISPQPKLLIVYQTPQTFTSESFQNILTYAWSFEFVDCTILVTNPENISSIIYYYNPFTGQSIENSAITELFPDKLCNLHGYPIKIPSIELPPYIHVIRDSEGVPIDMSGSSYQYCRLLSETLNFSTKIVPGFEDSVIRANFTALFEKLHSKEIDMLTFPFNVRSIIYDFREMLLIGKLFLDTNYVILVPIEPSIKIDIPLDVIIFVPLIFVIICAFQVFKKLFRFPCQHWRADKVFQILLGFTVPRVTPKTIVEKLMYMSLVTVSMKYSMHTLMKIMDIKIVKGEVSYDFLNDVAQSDLPIYTLDFIIGHVYANTDDEVLLKMKNKTHSILNIYQCFDEMAVNKSCMCIVPHSAGAYVAKQYVKTDGTPTTKVARPILYDDMAALGYARTSPFSSKFDEIIQRIVESGISDSWSEAQNYTIKPEDFANHRAIRENVFLQQLYVLLTVGYSIAGIVLVVEIVCAKTQRRIGKYDKNFDAGKLDRCST